MRTKIQGVKATDKAEYERLDGIVGNTKDAFIECGLALAEIQERQLYKAGGFKSFDAYCKDRHSIGRHRGYQLIKAASAAKSVDQSQQKPNTKQAEALAKAPEEKRAEVWDEVIAEGKPTAAKVAAKVAEKTGKDESSATDAAQESSPGGRGASGSTEASGDLAKKNKTLAHAHRDKLARAICDYHEVCPNRKERDRLVKLVQGIELW